MYSQICRLPKAWRIFQRQRGLQLLSMEMRPKQDQSSIQSRSIGNFTSPLWPVGMEKVKTGFPSTTFRRHFQSEGAYHNVADESLETIQDTIEETLEDAGIEAEISYSAGVLTMSLPPHGTYVLNKQTPNQVCQPLSLVESESRKLIRFFLLLLCRSKSGGLLQFLVPDAMNTAKNQSAGYSHETIPKV